MTETTEMDARRIVDLTVMELRELIRAEMTSTIDELFAAAIMCVDTPADKQLLRLRTLRANRGIGGAAGRARAHSRAAEARARARGHYRDPQP